MNHLTHPELFTEHDGLWALSPVKILAAIHAADKGLPCELWDSRCQQLQKFLATEKEHSAYWMENTRLHQARITELLARQTELEAAMRGLVEAVGNMRVPQTVQDAGLQILAFSPLLSAARTALQGNKSSRDEGTKL